MKAFDRTLEEVRAGLRALGLEPACKVGEGELEGCIGLFDPNYPETITIKNGLRGCRLWRVILHEYGHAFGLEHMRRGLMRAKSVSKADFSLDEPTTRQKKAWCAEIARLVLKKREKQWPVAA